MTADAPETPTDASRPPSRAAARRTVDGALAITNLTKLGGAALAINEALFRAELRPLALAVAALMIAGAQGIESILLAIIDRVLGTTNREG
jgi:hypothetical protein